MKKLVKVISLVVVLVMVLAYSLYFNRGSNKQISLDFANSGSFEWSEEVEIRNFFDSISLDFANSGSFEWSEEVEVRNFFDSISLDFANSGSFEWSEEVEIRGFINKFRRSNDFKNSGLPETIEFIKF
jgi:hypothetical protein